MLAEEATATLHCALSWFLITVKRVGAVDTVGGTAAFVVCVEVRHQILPGLVAPALSASVGVEVER